MSSAMERCKWIWEIQGNNQQVMITFGCMMVKGKKFKEASKVSGLSRFIKSDCHTLKYEILISKKGMWIEHVKTNRPL